MDIVAKAEAAFLAREAERRAKETWLEEQARLTTMLESLAYGTAERDLDDEYSGDEDTLAYCPSPEAEPVWHAYESDEDAEPGGFAYALR